MNIRTTLKAAALAAVMILAGCGKSNGPVSRLAKDMAARKIEDRKACMDNLEAISAACEMAKLDGIRAPKASDLYGEDKYLIRPPVCPTTKKPYSLEGTASDSWRPVCPNPTIGGNADFERHELPRK